MNIDYWAHWVVSVVALLAAIGIPIWQRRMTNADMIVSKRTLLLQSILSARSATYLSMWELRRFLAKVGDKIKPEQRTTITDMVAKLQGLHDRLESIHDRWLKYSSGKGLRDIEQALLHVDALSSDVKDVAKMSESLMKGTRS